MNENKPLDGLVEFNNKIVYLDLKNNTTIKGKIKAFDYNMHILLENAEEISEGNTSNYGTMLIRGNMVICVYPSKD
jgi:small nuclear ribonucleoprotein